LLFEFEELFDGTLGDWKWPPVSIEMKEGAKPYHGRPYPIAQIHKANRMKEMNRLEGIGVLKRQTSSQWASPTFIIPKKDMTVRTITDFRKRNKRIVRRPYPIPKISTTLQELEGFTYASALDLNMGYYTIRLDPKAVKMFTIIFPWGKYSYMRLPMGFAGSADIFQAEMMDLMESLEYVRAYIDDLVETNMTQTNHVFANRSEENEIYPLTVKEIVEAQQADTTLKHFFKRNAVLDKGLELQLIENESCICNKGRLVIPKPLQRRATMWYHRYLQHPGHTRLEETMKSAIYWKGMRNTVRSITKSCKSCQVNKKVHKNMDICHLKS
jgi:hypothetical protein